MLLSPFPVTRRTARELVVFSTLSLSSALIKYNKNPGAMRSGANFNILLLEGRIAVDELFEFGFVDLPLNREGKP